MRRLRFALVAFAAAILVAPAASAANCRNPHFPPTKITHRAPPRALVDNMAVLRRAQQDGDIPPVKLELFPFRLFAIDYVRKLGEGPHGESYYIVPGSIAYPHLPKRCLRRLSPRRRRIEHRLEQQGRKRERIIGLGLFEFDFGSRGVQGGGGGCCADAHALFANRTVQTSGSGHSTVTGLVPDGVVSVTLRWHRGPERNVTVANNFWLTTVPLSAPRAFPHSTIWRDAEGHVVKSFRQPGGR
jgi:hypothetical protein